MEALQDWMADVADTLAEQLSVGAEVVPGLLGALLILILGWLLARGVRRAIRRAAEGANRLLGRVFPSGRLAGVRVSNRVAGALGEIGFFSILLLALVAAARVGGLRTLSGWLERITVYLPNLLVAFAIILAGYLLGIYLRELVVRMSGSAGGTGSRLAVARFVQGFAIAVAAIVALDQIGIDVTLLIALAVIVAASIGMTLGVSLALGARGHVSNLMGIRAARGRLSNGVTIRIDGVAGQVIEITNTEVVLETDEGTALLPGHLLSKQVTTILAPETREGDDDAG